MFKTIELKGCSSTDFTIVYWMFDKNCVFLQLSPTSPNITINFAEEIRAAIYNNEADLTATKKRLRFFNLVIMESKDRNYEPIKVFEFVEIIDDPKKTSGVAIDFLQTIFPDEVKVVFAKYLRNCKKQTYETIASGHGRKIYRWDPLPFNRRT